MSLKPLDKIRKCIVKWLFPDLEDNVVNKITKRRRGIVVIKPYDLESDQKRRAEEAAKEQELPNPIK